MATPPRNPDYDVASMVAHGAKSHWERIRRTVNVRIAALVFALAVISVLCILNANEQTAREYCFKINKQINYRDLSELNEFGDFLLQDYLSGKSQPGDKELVILGASFAATSLDPQPSQRLHSTLERALFQQAGEQYSCVNLATPGYNNWSLMYVARLLRMRRPPHTMVVSLDAFPESDRNLHLLLNTGGGLGLLTSRELAAEVPLNRQLLATVEAKLLHGLETRVPFVSALNYLEHSYPKKDSFIPWLKLTFPQLFGGKVESVPSGRHPDGTPKAWREIPEHVARIEFETQQGIRKREITAAAALDLELLGHELAQCQAQGINVLVVTMPRNLARPLDATEANAWLDDWAKHYGLEFHSYFTSGLIPDQYYHDSGHFFGQGNEIMGQELARLITQEDE